MEDLGGLKVYVSGDPKSKHAIILVSDIYGYEAPNLRKIADKVAAFGFYVVVPDFFRGEPYVDNNPKRPLDVWLKEHPQQKGFEDSKSVIAVLKKRGISVIGAAGFCWGGKVVVDLAKTNMIKAIVALHPSLVTVDDIKDVKQPIAILGAEKDEITPPTLVKQFQEILSKKHEIDSFVKIFSGVAHGFSVRYKADDKFAVKKAEEAQKDMLHWFLKHIN
ncbi:hypothetical protein J5N97_028149 [Dioscorea zingiberensis]|uniref:Dienelactone hydrolase domain-containing protein n=1 Tax=Dioscorea zingiberensis TaxID=325984 RepID=A0A9D5BZ10_9LILI|nr:hypothetical protein J5N97_028149 [Dioscorea zingiberensis]